MGALSAATLPGLEVPPGGLRARVETHGRVAVLRLEGPPPSRWDIRDRALFIGEIQRLATDPERQAIVLHGRRLFEDATASPGAGLDPAFPEVLAAISDCKLPVVAAIAGHALGAGLELALACAGRVAAPTATFAFPGVLFGRLPVNGAIDRLPRLIGLEAAAGLIVFGQALDARAATEAGLVDALASRNLVAFAANFAAGGPLARAGAPARAVEPEVAQAQLYGLRLKLRLLAPNQAAPLAALRAMDAGMRLPSARAGAEIRRIASEFAGSAQGCALAYAERGWAELPRQRPVTELAKRLAWPMLREAVHLLDEGATPGQVDRCLVAYGFHEGPFAKADRLGLGAVFSAGDGLATSEGWLAYSATLDLMSDAGRHGGPGAPGWYRRAPDAATPGLDAEVEKLLQASATFQRLRRGPVPDEVIVERCLYAAMNAAAACLDAAPNLSARQIDAIWTSNLDFPLWKGGPLFQARIIGPERVAGAFQPGTRRCDTAGPASAGLLALARIAEEIRATDAS